MHLDRRTKSTSSFTALALAVLAGAAHPQSAGPKVPRPLPRLDDVKIGAPKLVLTEHDVAGERRASGTATARASTLDPASIVRGTLPSTRDRLEFEATEDGVQWVRGANWKASFAPTGATYVPFFGSAAPRNFPITLAVVGARAGETTIALAEATVVVRRGTRCTLDRGGVVEHYDLALASIEQSFVLDSLPERGEIVLRLAIDTELDSTAHAGGLRFSNELGHVDYGRPTVVDAAGRSRSLAVVLDENAFEIRVPADFVASASLPITIDPVITTFSVDSSIQDHVQPDVAYDASNDRWLVTYTERFSQTDHDVQARLLDGAGQFLLFAALDVSTDSWERPRVANNNLANQFLVAAEVRTPAEASAMRIRARTVAAADLALGAKFTISGTEPGIKVNCDVGGDPELVGPTYYCVVWERLWSSTDRDVHYRIVQADGTLIGPATQHVDNSSGTIDRNPVVSKSNGAPPFDTQRWNVVYDRTYSATDRDVYGAQIGWDGTLQTPPFPIDLSTIDDHFPVASSLLDGASGARSWLAVFNRPSGATTDLVAYAYQGSTLLATTNLSALEDLAGSGTLAEYQAGAGADSDGLRFAVVYVETTSGPGSDVDAYAATLELSGGVLSLAEGHQPLAVSSTYVDRLTLASSYGGGGARGRFLGTWSVHASSLLTAGDIDGAIYAVPAFDLFCHPGDDAIACPCGNDPSDGTRGCENSGGTGGAFLGAQGVPANDDVVLTAGGILPTPTCFFLQGNSITTGGAAFGDGVRCVGGTLKRLYVKNAQAGVVAAPTGSEPSIQERSAELGDVIAPGSTRRYQVYYRDSADFACASPATFNITNGVSIHW